MKNERGKRRLFDRIQRMETRKEDDSGCGDLNESGPGGSNLNV